MLYFDHEMCLQVCVLDTWSAAGGTVRVTSEILGSGAY